MRNFNRDRRRDSDRHSYNDRHDGRPQMTQATCAECGKACEVPFVPTEDRPVFCSDCFENKDRKGGKRFGGRGNGGGFADRYDNRNSGRRSYSNRSDRYADRSTDRNRMYQATCAQCGNECEIPFRPTGERPVYCSQCFEDRQNDSYQPTTSKGPSAEYSEVLQLCEILNAKLDQIVHILASNSVSINPSVTETVSQLLEDTSLVTETDPTEEKPVKKTRKKKEETNQELDGLPAE